MKILSRFLAASALLASASSAQAVALGDTVTCASNVLTCSRSSATVNAASEFTLTYGGFDVLYADFTTNVLTITTAYAFNTTLSDLTLSFTDTTLPFTKATLTSTTGAAGVDPTDVFLNGGTLKLNLANATFASGARIVVAAPAPVASVPEPATWAMMIGGFGMIGFALRRRRRTNLAAIVSNR